MWAVSAEEAYFKVLAVRGTVEEICSRVRGGASATHLCNIVKSATQRMARNIEAEPELFADHLGPASIFHVLLRFVEASEIARIPDAMVGPLRALLGRYAAAPEVLVWYDWTPSNYSFSPGLAYTLRKVIRQIFEDDLKGESLQKEVPDLFAVISIPASDRDNVLQHATIGHELGHALSLHFKDLDACSDALEPDPEALDAVFEAIVQGGEAPPGQLSLYAKQGLRRRAVRTIQQWANELLADVWAIRLLGPTPLLSLLHAGGRQEALEDHPPTYLRGQAMFEALDRCGFGAQSIPWLDQSFSAMGKCMAETRWAAEAHHVLATQTLEAQMGLLVEQVFRQKAGLDPFTYEAWSAGSDSSQAEGRHEFVEQILHHVPPCGCMEGASVPSDSVLPSILMAGWNVWLDEEGCWEPFCGSLGAEEALSAGRSQAFEKLNALVLKGLEMEHLRMVSEGDDSLCH